MVIFNYEVLLSLFFCFVLFDFLLRSGSCLPSKGIPILGTGMDGKAYSGEQVGGMGRMDGMGWDGARWRLICKAVIYIGD